MNNAGDEYTKYDEQVCEWCGAVIPPEDEQYCRWCDDVFCADCLRMHHGGCPEDDNRI